MAPQEIDPDQAEGLALLGLSQGLMRLLFTGLALQYRAMDLQRCQLLAPPEEAACLDRQSKILLVLANLITLVVIRGFLGQSQALAQKAAQTGACPDTTDIQLNTASLLLSLLRLERLLPRPSSQTETVRLPEEDAQAPQVL